MLYRLADHSALRHRRTDRQTDDIIMTLAACQYDQLMMTLFEHNGPCNMVINMVIAA